MNGKTLSLTDVATFFFMAVFSNFHPKSNLIVINFDQQQSVSEICFSCPLPFMLFTRLEHNLLQLLLMVGLYQ